MTRVLALDTHPIQYKVPVYRRLQQTHGYDVTVLYASDFSVKPYADEEFGIELEWDVDLLSGYRAVFGTRAEPGERPVVSRLPCRRLLRTLLDVRPNVMLLSQFFGRFGAESVAQLVGLPIPWVYFAETTDHAAPRSASKARARDFLLRGLYRRASALGYIGQRSRSHYERLGVPGDKLFFTPYGVETAPFRTTEADRFALREPCRAAHGVAPEQLALMFSGKLSERKDPARIIEAVRSLPEALRRRVVILYLGDGQLATCLSDAAAQEPAVEVRMLGFKNQREISSYYHAADAVVLPSVRGETWGLVNNEALVHGTPILSSSQVGSTPDLVVEGVTGHAFEAGSSAALARAIERLPQLLEAPTTRAKCREHAARYTLDATARGLADALASATK